MRLLFASRRARRVDGKLALRRAAAAVRPWGGLEPLEQRTLLSSSALIVTSAAPVSAGPGELTLRQAILQANSNSAIDTILFDSTALSGQSIDLTSALPAINSDLTITGLGADLLTINGQGLPSHIPSNIFRIAPGATVNISGITLSGVTNTGDGGAILNFGTLTVSQTVISGNTANVGGAAANWGSLTFVNSQVVNNTAIDGGGIFNFDQFNGQQAELTVQNSTISGNSASFLGGGIRNQQGTVTISGSTISGNEAVLGGGIANGGTLTVSRSTLSGNSAAEHGGAIFNQGRETDAPGFKDAVLTVRDSTISGNSAGVDGGGIYNSILPHATGDGRGVAFVINSTVSGNSAGNWGGGIINRGAELTVVNSTVVLNHAGVNTGGIFTLNSLPPDNIVVAANATLHNTIVAGNTSNAGDGLVRHDDLDGSPGVHSSSSNNLISSSEVGGPPGESAGLQHGVNGNIVGNGFGGTIDLDTIIDTHLANNGGPTLTHALVAGSPAINAGNNARAVDAANAPLVYDQRGQGFPRIAGGTVDIGAIEAEFQQQTQTITITGLPTNVPYGASVQINASATSGLPVSLLVDSGPATIEGNVLTITGVGPVTIIAVQEGDETYAPAELTRVIQARPAAPQISVQWTGGTYNGSAFEADVTVTGRAGESLSISSITYFEGSTASGTPLPGAPVNAGTYTLRATYAGDENHLSHSVTATITIDKAELIVAVDNQAKTYDGEAFAGFTVSYSGFVAGEGEDVLGGELSFAGDAAAAVNAGTYQITASGLTSNNYHIAFVAGTLTIHKAVLQVDVNIHSESLNIDRNGVITLLISGSDLINVHDHQNTILSSLAFIYRHVTEAGSVLQRSSGPINPLGYTLTSGGSALLVHMAFDDLREFLQGIYAHLLALNDSKSATLYLNGDYDENHTFEGSDNVQLLLNGKALRDFLDQLSEYEWWNEGA